ncbi:MAG TPA: Mur ligase family protein, partial [Myxococcota bacterium]|nr:Mur ligase family protein [Myxococcota bacterium]
HVAGSKGKGSTALLAEALLRARGERVGTFTSPHLSSWTERFRIDGREVAEARLVAAVDALRPHVEALRAGPPEGVPSWFDVTTAAAFWIFRDAGVGRAVVEVGLGGRLDSTNVVEPQVACITTIEREHTRYLGETLAAIAGEKAGIIKPGRPVVMGDLAPEAGAVVEARAKGQGAPLARLGQDFSVEVLAADADGLALHLRDGELELDVRLPILGAHQAANAALALACAKRLPGVEAGGLGEAATRGFASARLPGRVERLAADPPVIVDGAHTPASARALAAALALLPQRKRRLVLSVSADKDLPEILAPLLPGAVEVTVTRAEPTRSLDPKDVAAVVRRLAPGVALRAIPNPFLALRSARERQAADEILCAAGSVYLAGIARRVLRP